MSIKQTTFALVLFLSCSACSIPEQDTDETVIPEITQAPEETKDTTIYLKHDSEIWLDQLEAGDTEQLLADEKEFLYPETCYFKPRLMNSSGILFGEESLEHNSSRFALLSLDLNTGEYRELTHADRMDQFNQMVIQFCNNDYLIYGEVNSSELIFSVWYLDLKTLEKTQLFYETNYIPARNTMWADADENGNFMFTVFSQKAQDNQLYYVSKDTLEPELIADSAYMPVYVNKSWYCIKDNDTLLKITHDNIEEIQTEGLLGRIYEIKAVDDAHLLMIDVGNSASPHSRAYMIDMTSLKAEYLFRQNTVMEMTDANHQYIKWKGGQLEGSYALRENLYDYKNKLFYPIETNYIFLSENGFSYRKFLIPVSEAVPGTMMDRDVSCISFISDN